MKEKDNILLIEDDNILLIEDDEFTQEIVIATFEDSQESSNTFLFKIIPYLTVILEDSKSNQEKN